MNLDDRVNLEEADLDKLLTPTSFIILPLINEAAVLETIFDKQLKPVQEGVYRAGSISALGSNEISNFDPDYKLYVPDDNVISKLQNTNNKNKRLYCKPTIPVRGIQLIQHCINSEINKINPFGRNYHVDSLINSLIKNDCEITSDDIIRECSHILKNLITFIGNDVWHIYFAKLKGTDIFIIKTIDYRIYDWHLSIYKKQIREKEEKY